MRRTFGILALCILAVGCRKSPSPHEPADVHADAGVEVVVDGGGDEAGPADDEGKSDEGGDKGGEAGGLPGPTLPDGALCDTHADCGDGMQCEGVGCEPGQGRCVSKDRICTRDLAQYCGCDGELFQASGSCAGDRYAYRGPCEPKFEDGEACTDGRQCSSGQCVGDGLEGCSRDAVGVCGQTDCTQDYAVYCGCNNTEFRGSGSCPNRQFAYRGPCEDGG